jgi:three-Cys-motif partner protein
MNPLPRLTDDGLITPPVRGWSEDKYRHVLNYAQMFATATKKHWNCRAYVDLYAGAGRSKLETGAIIAASPLLALELKDPFDKYVFCDMDGEKLEALRVRVGRDHPGRDCAFINRDTNAAVDEILAEVPMGSRDFRVLSFCFADPYKLKNLRFETIRRLTARYADFLVLVPSGMDANRNLVYYERADNRTLDDFLGTTAWREAWTIQRGGNFGDFVADQFGKQMAALGYRYDGLQKTTLIRSTDKNLPLYRLMFFSKSELADKLWAQTQKYSTPQRDLFG